MIILGRKRPGKVVLCRHNIYEISVVFASEIFLFPHVIIRPPINFVVSIILYPEENVYIFSVSICKLQVASRF